MTESRPPEQNPQNPASTPQDQHWSHVRETVNMLCLAVCQIEAALEDSGSSVDTLTNSFTEIAQHNTEVGEQLRSLDKVEQLELFKDDLQHANEAMKANINAAIEAFQFYDRVCQRLDHVSKSLEKVSDLMDTHQHRNSPQAWKGLQKDIKESYSMQAERVMFEFIMQGGGIKEALKVYRQFIRNQENKADDVELF